MLKLNHVTKTLKGLRRPALSNIHFSLKAGEFCILLGANGSGKSTLMKLISGAYKPDSGMIERQGMIPEMTLLENIRLIAKRIKIENKYKSS